MSLKMRETLDRCYMIFILDERKNEEAYLPVLVTKGNHENVIGWYLKNGFKVFVPAHPWPVVEEVEAVE